MKRHILIVSVILTALLAASCSVYHPQMVDVPLLHHKGDGHVDLGMSMQWLGVPTSAEWNLSASYAPTDWLALQAAGVYDMSKTGFAQAAVGSYLPWDNFVMLPNDCQKLLISKYWKLGLKNSKTRDLKEEYQKLFGNANQNR